MPSDARPVPALPAAHPSIRLEPAPPAEAGGTPRTKALLSLGTTWKSPIDITGDLIGALAHVLWRSRGGHDVENWVDAERLLHSLMPGTATMPKAAATQGTAAIEPKAGAPTIAVVPQSGQAVAASVAKPATASKAGKAKR
ncbi:MAG: hypothetical protein ACKVW3_01190 [Phycisphaerales bacterium]